MTHELVAHNGNTQSVSVFANSNNFEHAQRIAKMLASSNLVPTEYQGNVPNTLVALEMANRVGASPLQVMQNLNVINGRPSWSSPFIIAAINTCGRFAPLEFEFQERGPKKLQYEHWTGSKAQNNRRKETGHIDINDTACRAYTTDKTGKVVHGPWVSIEIAVHEGWYTKSDSKWRTMPEVMLRYRAAAFFGRLYCPEILLGMQTSEELHDITPVEVTAEPVRTTVPTTATVLQNFNAAVSQQLASEPSSSVDNPHSQASSEQSSATTHGGSNEPSSVEGAEGNAPNDDEMV